MTEAEYEAKIAELENKNQELAQDNERLSVNEKNQNSYITKLEAKVKNPSPDPVNTTLVDKRFAAYLERNIRKDAIADATATIKSNVSPEVYACLEPELMEMLDKYMTIDKTKESFIIDSFNLIYGQAMSNKEHPIHKIGQVQKEDAPVAQQVNNVAQNTNVQQKNVSNISDQLRAFMGTPPTMTPSDMNAAQTPPAGNTTPIKNTKDAITAFKERMKSAGANKFS